MLIQPIKKEEKDLIEFMLDSAEAARSAFKLCLNDVPELALLP